MRRPHRAILIELFPSTDAPALASLPDLLRAAHHPYSRTLLNRVLFWRRRPPMSFEIWSASHHLSLVFYAERIEDLRRFTYALSTLYPNLQSHRTEDEPFQAKAGEYVCAGTLRAPVLHAFPEISTLTYDSLRHLLEAQSRLSEKTVVQILFRPLWPGRLLRRKTRELGPLLAESTSRFEVVVRYAAVSPSPQQAYYAAKLLGDVLQTLAHPGVERGIFRYSLPWRNSSEILVRLIRRAFPRWIWENRFLLEPAELATLVHSPIGYAGRGFRPVGPSLPPPTEETKGDVILGHAVYRGKKTHPVGLSLQDLTRGIWVLGSAGSGKTTSLLRLCHEAFEKGLCVHFIDPHGDAALELLKALPPKLFDRVIYLDPLQTRYSLNPWEVTGYRSPEERELMVERLVTELATFLKKLFGYWSPGMERAVTESLRALYTRKDAPTFSEVHGLLTGESPYAQEEFAKRLARELEKVPRASLDAVLTRLSPYVKNPLLRTLFSNPKSTLDFRDLVDHKLVIWRVSKAELGEGTMALATSAIINKLWFHAITREVRTPVLLVVDEAQNVSEQVSFQLIATEGRKFKVSLVASHQGLSQLTSDTVKLLMGNLATKLIFRVSGEDAHTLARTVYPQRAELMAQMLAGFPDAHAILSRKVGFGELPPPFEIATLPPLEVQTLDVAPIVERMRERFGAPPVEIPKEIEKQIATPEILNLLWAVHALESRGAEPTTGATLEEMRKESQRRNFLGSQLKALAGQAEASSLLTVNEVRQPIGRPKKILRLTEKGRRTLGVGPSPGAKGGPLHRRMVEKVAESLRAQGYHVEIETTGPTPKPNLVLFERTRLDHEEAVREVAYEIEVSAKHPEQIRRNFEKNVEMGREVVFIVPDVQTKAKVVAALGEYADLTRVDVFPIDEGRGEGGEAG